MSWMLLIRKLLCCYLSPVCLLHHRNVLAWLRDLNMIFSQIPLSIYLQKWPVVASAAARQSRLGESEIVQNQSGPSFCRCWKEEQRGSIWNKYSNQDKDYNNNSNLLIVIEDLLCVRSCAKNFITIT